MSNQVAVFNPPRLPHHPKIQERFGIDASQWIALVEAIFPNAQSVGSIVQALSYCRARNLDVFKRPVHIVPVWSKQAGKLVDTVWPGIGELRTTAFRTGAYAGRDDAEFGEDITRRLGEIEMTFPEWCRVKVYRMVQGERVAFSGSKIYWLETYSTAKGNSQEPNQMWKDRPRGQIEKCAEAAALRAAFPEEIGGDHIPEEIRSAPIIDAKPAAQPLKSLEEFETDALPAPTEQTDTTTGEVTAAKDQLAEFEGAVS